jgi:hypothetical protein
MRRSTVLGIAVVLVAAFAGLQTSASLAGGGPDGFLTARRPYLVPLVNGVRIEPLISTGDGVGSYQMSGIPDGLGAYRSSNRTIELFMNHELERDDGDPANSRVSHLTLANDGSVLSGSYPVDGTEGFTCFCSSTLRATTKWSLAPGNPSAPLTVSITCLHSQTIGPFAPSLTRNRRHGWSRNRGSLSSSSTRRARGLPLARRGTLRPRPRRFLWYGRVTTRGGSSHS